MDILDRLQAKINNYWDIFILSIPKIAISILVLAIFIFLAISLSRIVKKRFTKRVENRLVLNFVLRLLKIVIIIVGIILALNTVGFTNLAGGLVAGAGAGAIILGFAFKEIGENFLSGMLLVFDRPFNVGDTVTIQNTMGKVVELRFRNTLIKGMNGADIFIPNASIIKNEVINHTQDGFLRSEFIIGIDYQADIDEATKVIKTAVTTHPEIIRDEQTQVLINDFGTTVNLKILFWTNTLDYKLTANQTKAQVMILVKNALMSNGFAMPSGFTEIKIRDGVNVNNKIVPPKN